MSIRSELLRIQQADPGHVLYPRDVVEWARDNPDSALYRALEWDNQRAADAHRLWQVRQIITLHIVNEIREPQMVSLTIDRVGDGGYRSISDVIQVPDLRDGCLQMLWQNWNAFRLSTSAFRNWSKYGSRQIG